MSDDFSILPKWNRLHPTEKLGNSKESFVSEIGKRTPQKKKKRRKGRDSKPDSDQGEEGRFQEGTEDTDTQSGKILDITI